MFPIARRHVAEVAALQAGEAAGGDAREGEGAAELDEGHGSPLVDQRLRHAEIPRDPRSELRALTVGGGAKCWGNNSGGSLGNNSTTDSSVPVDVAGLSAGVVSITAGAGYACAVTDSGGAKCWGTNGNGQLGNNSTIQSLIPVNVVNP